MPRGTLQLRCKVCGATAREGRPGDQCRYGCYDLYEGVQAGWFVWDGNRQLLRILKSKGLELIRRPRTWDKDLAWLKARCKVRHNGSPQGEN